MYSSIVTTLRLLFLLVICHFPLGAWSFFSNTPETPQPPPVTFTLMIDPAGDVRDPGREIDDTFERSITMQVADELKKELEAHIPGTRVILTRLPGEISEPLQNVSFANRLKIDLYVSLNFFWHKQKLNKVYLYHLIYNPSTDFMEKKKDELSLLPYDQAYRLSIKRSASFANSFYDFCKKEEGPYKISCMQPLALPFKPLIGIAAPAMGIEIGIKRKDDVKELMPLLISAFETIINAAKNP